MKLIKYELYNKCVKKLYSKHVRIFVIYRLSDFSIRIGPKDISFGHGHPIVGYSV